MFQRQVEKGPPKLEVSDQTLQAGTWLIPAWHRKHVLQDLRPYVCTSPACNLLMFPDSDSWFKHELDEHRFEWSCRFCVHKPTDTVEEYRSHLRAHHEALLQSIHLPTLLKASQQPATTIQASSCLFCDPQVNDESLPLDIFDFKIHVAEHMEQLALFALPRVSDVGEGSWESAKPVVPLNTAENIGQGADQSSHELKDPPLHVAAFEGRGIEIRRMLQDGHDIDASGTTWGSVLGAAIAGGHPAVTKLLVDSGADLHLRCAVDGSDSTTALQAAAAMKNSLIEKILLDAEDRNERPRIYGETNWKLESVATKFERLTSRYSGIHDDLMLSYHDGMGAMEIISSCCADISKHLRTVSAELDPNSDKQASLLKHVMNFLPRTLSGLEAIHDLIDLLFEYFFYDSTETGRLEIPAYHCLSQFNDSVLRIILKTPDRSSLTDFLDEECIPLLERLATGFKKLVTI